MHIHYASKIHLYFYSIHTFKTCVLHAIETQLKVDAGEEKRAEDRGESALKVSRRPKAVGLTMVSVEEGGGGVSDKEP